MAVAETGRSVPLNPDMIEMPASAGGPPRLVGSCCPACGARFAARRAICLQCAHRGLERCTLSPTGTVWTFTIVRQQPPGSILRAPYAIAQVQLDDGPIVAAPLVETAIEAVRVGLPVEITLCDAGRDADGNALVAHAFRARQEETA